MEYNIYEGARGCVERLSEDFLRIKKDHIDQRNYQRAYESWEFALLDSQHGIFASAIVDAYHQGFLFNASIHMLRDSLHTAHEDNIRFSTENLLLFIRQQELRDKVEKGE